MKTALKVLGVIALLLILLLAGLVAYLYTSAIRPSSSVGFQQIAAVDPGNEDLARFFERQLAGR